MTVAFVEVMNNTSLTLHYYNEVTKYTIDQEAKSTQFENDGYIPTSDFYNDEVPLHSSDDRIKVWLGDGPTIAISDWNWQFCLNGPAPDTSGSTEERYGSLRSNGQYVLRIDETWDGKKKIASVTIYEYQDKLKVTAGYIALSVIQQAGPVVALVLMAIFL